MSHLSQKKQTIIYYPRELEVHYSRLEPFFSDDAKTFHIHVDCVKTISV